MKPGHTHLKGVAQGDNIRMQHSSERFTLCFDIFPMLLLQHLLLAHHLHRIDAARGLLPHLEHLHEAQAH